MRLVFFFILFLCCELRQKKNFVPVRSKKKLLWAKPQNRTEVSPTTMECSTVELELPLCVSFIIVVCGMSYQLKGD